MTVKNQIEEKEDKEKIFTGKNLMTDRMCMMLYALTTSIPTRRSL